MCQLGKYLSTTHRNEHSVFSMIKIQLYAIISFVMCESYIKLNCQYNKKNEM